MPLTVIPNFLMENATLVKGLAARPTPEMPESFHTCGTGGGFVPAEDLQDLDSPDEEKKDMQDLPEPEDDQEEEQLKEATAYQLGLQYAWKEAGVADDVRRHLLTKIAVYLQDGTITSPLHLLAAQPEMAKEASELMDLTDEQFGREVQKLAKLDDDTRLLLYALLGAGIGGGGGFIADSLRDKLTNRHPSSALTLTGALAGASAGAMKHMYDRQKQD